MKNANESSTTNNNKKRLLSAPLSENKKTRDLPNFSECQACGFRIDASTGKTRIQILYSEWRLVLLCKLCLSRVESSHICSYCFKETIKDFFTCCQCKRSVHRNCFLKYKNARPWSYSYSNSCSSSEFSVCVDCWLPKSLIKTRGRLRSSRGFEKLNSRVSNAGGHCANSSKVVVKDPICASENKIVLALMATRTVGRKPMVRNGTNKNGGNGSESVVRKHGDDGNNKKVVFNDTEYAFKLHRAMNSSPRISKNLCAVNSNCSGVSKMRESDDDLVYGGSDSGDPSVSCDHAVCIDKKVSEDLERSVSDHLACVKVEDMAVQFKEGEESCSNKLVKSVGDENSMNFVSRSCHSNHYDCTTCKAEVCNKKPDRYLLKYRKRNSSSKPLAEGKSGILYERFSNQSQPLAAGLSSYCSTESRTLSNGSLQSCAFLPQAPTCISGLSPDDS